MTYPYLPDLPSQVAEIVAALTEALAAAWEALASREEAILAAIADGDPSAALARIGALTAALDEFQATVEERARAFAADDVPLLYATGAQAANPGEAFAWTELDIQVVTQLAADAYTDLLKRSAEARRTTEAFIRKIRSVARDVLPKMATLGDTAQQTARELAAEIRRRYGIEAVIYRDGSRRTIETYADMLAYTKSAVAYNMGGLHTWKALGTTYVEVFDGAGCGWTSHLDPDKANGTVRPLEEAMSYPIAHPHCTRTFGARPDVTTDEEARAASAG